MRIALVSGGNAIRTQAHVNHAAYAAEHGLAHRLEVAMTPNAPYVYYYKLSVLDRVLADYDWIVWLDDDLYITDFSSTALVDHINRAEAAGQFCVIAEGPRESLDPKAKEYLIWSRINAGAILLKNEPRSAELIRRALAMDVSALRATWDSSAWGIFTGGDQDALCQVLHEMDPEGNQYEIVHHRTLNSREHYYERSPQEAFSVHFCGGAKEVRRARFCRRLNLPPLMIPSEVADKYGIDQGSLLSRRDEELGRLAERARKLARRVRAKVEFVRRERRWR